MLCLVALETPNLDKPPRKENKSLRHVADGWTS